MSSSYIAFQSIRALGQTFAERIGPADEVSSALGHIFLGFSWLEDSIDRHIAELAKLAPSVAPAFMAEMSFSRKVAVLSSLVQQAVRPFNVGTEDPSEVWDDLAKMVLECKKLRSKFIHSHLSPRKPGYLTRTTIYASGRLLVPDEDFTADHLLDIYDYILNVECVFNEFFLEPPPPAHIPGMPG